MTDAPDTIAFDVREQLARIDQALADAHKLRLESEKYAAETRKLDREYRWFPWLQLGLAIIAAASVVAASAVAIVVHLR